MGKTLEQTIHEADLPNPAPGGEDFRSYVNRVAHAAAFIGAAWAIANGPVPELPQPIVTTTPVEEDRPADEPVWLDDDEDEDDGEWDSPGEVGPEHIHQDEPSEVVREHD